MRSPSIAVTVFIVFGAGVLGAQHGGGDMKMKMAPTVTDDAQAKMKQAMLAAPPDVSANATIMDWPEKDGMPMKALRTGTNGWTCMPSSPAAPDGPAGEDPMCVDQEFSKLLEAWSTKSVPTLSRVAIAYMLRGDKGASNTDPFAMSRTATNNWIVSPPHLMIALPDPRQLDAFPTDPSGGGPWVMWKGTKYAHLMVPTAAMPKAMTAAKRMSQR